MNVLQALADQGAADGLYLGAAYMVLRHPDEVLAAGGGGGGRGGAGGSAGGVAAGAAGLAREDPGVPASEATVWDLASLTKGVATATSLLILAQEGAFHLDEDVARFLPGEAPSLAGITLRHCMTHSSGLKAWE